MSASVLRRAVRNRLLSDPNVTLRKGECEVADGPRPPSLGRDIFIGIHPGGWYDDSEDHYHREIFAVDITVSVLLARFPRDRWGDKLTGDTVGEGLEDFCRLVIGSVHNSPTLLSLANTELGTDKSVFSEMLKFKNAGRPIERGLDWWGGYEKDGKVCGLSITLSFDGAVRSQHIGSYT